MPFTYSEQDVMDIWYWLKEDGKVRVYVRVKDSVERQLQGEGEPFIWGK
jgi:hypothetical protein